jgi:hypothetical protein
MNWLKSLLAAWRLSQQLPQTQKLERLRVLMQEEE